MKSNSVARIIAVCIVLSALVRIALPVVHHIPHGRIDIYSRSRQLKVIVKQVYVDAIGAILTLKTRIKSTQIESNVYLLYRIGNKSGWNRINIENPKINISSLDKGKHILQLMAVEDGIVYQTPFTEVKFNIQRDEETVAEELAKMLKSYKLELENLAVEFLSYHFHPYVDLLTIRYKDDERVSFLLDAARDRRHYRDSYNPADIPRINLLVRHEKGNEIWDFSRNPSLNLWYAKKTLKMDLSQVGVRSLYYDGNILWFGHYKGVGGLNLKNDDLTLYGTEDGLPTPPTGGIKKALNGNIYAGTSRHLARYDEEFDRFVRVKMERTEKLNISGMEVDEEGKLWMVSKESRGGVSCYDGKRWWHFGAQHLTGITRDPNGLIWAGANAEHNDVEWQGLCPVNVLMEGAKIKSRGHELIFADYLGRLVSDYQMDGIPSRPQWIAWPEPSKKKPKQGQKITNKILFDFTNREFWIVEESHLINDTRRFDSRILKEEKWIIPVPEIESRYWYDICFVEKNQVYLGTKRGLYKFDGQSWQHVMISKEETQEVDIPLWALQTGRFSHSWHDGALFKRLSPTKIEINKPFPGKKQPRGKFYEISKKNIENYFLIEVTDDGQKYEYKFQPPFRYYPDLLFADYNGNIWATGVNYLYLFNGRSIKTYTSKSSQHIPNDHIYSFAADPAGDVWIGTETGLCLFRKGFFVKPPKQISGTIFAMTYDSINDRLILSSFWNGFYIKDSNDVWTHYKIPYSGNGRHDQMVRSISFDKEGTLWLATNSGLVSFSQKNKKWVKYGNEFTHGMFLAHDNIIYVNSSPDYVLIPKQETDAIK